MEENNQPKKKGVNPIIVAIVVATSYLVFTIPKDFSLSDPKTMGAIAMAIASGIVFGLHTWDEDRKKKKKAVK